MLKSLDTEIGNCTGQACGVSSFRPSEGLGGSLRFSRYDCLRGSTRIGSSSLAGLCARNIATHGSGLRSATAVSCLGAGLWRSASSMGMCPLLTRRHFARAAILPTLHVSVGGRCSSLRSLGSVASARVAPVLCAWVGSLSSGGFVISLDHGAG